MGKRILITDDALFMRMTLRNIVAEAGYEVAGEAKTGREAVEMYAQLKPDVVLMDITMPDMDGITALKSIRQSDPNANVVMCTAMGQKQLVIEAVRAGAKDYIVKPFENQRVLDSLAKVVG